MSALSCERNPHGAGVCLGTSSAAPPRDTGGDGGPARKPHDERQVVSPPLSRRRCRHRRRAWSSSIRGRVAREQVTIGK